MAYRLHSLECFPLGLKPPAPSPAVSSPCFPCRGGLDPFSYQPCNYVLAAVEGTSTRVSGKNILKGCISPCCRARRGERSSGEWRCKPPVACLLTVSVFDPWLLFPFVCAFLLLFVFTEIFLVGIDNPLRHRLRNGQQMLGLIVPAPTDCLSVYVRFACSPCRYAGFLLQLLQDHTLRCIGVSKLPSCFLVWCIEPV